jgi:hypothetical protein
LLVTLDDATGQHVVSVDQRVVGKTRFERREIDAATLDSQPALVAQLAKGGDPDLVLDVRLIGVRPDGLDLDMAEVEQSLRGTYLRVRVRDVSHPAHRGVPAARDHRRLVHPQRRGPDRARGVRDDSPAARPTSCDVPARSPAAAPSDAVGSRPSAHRPAAVSRPTFELAPGLTIVRGPNEAGSIQRTRSG